MNFWTRLCKYIENTVLCFKKIVRLSNSKETLKLETTEVSIGKDIGVVVPKMDTVSLERRTRLTKFYMLEQEIEIFKNDFPDKYAYFLEEIQKLRKRYNLALEKTSEKFTLEVNPEKNGELLLNICDLENQIERFINTEVKFEILSKKFQKLITKLNILYNVSIAHPKERDKVITQVLRAANVEIELVKEFKSCEYALKNSILKDRIVTLISYADYQIFKIILRNSENQPTETFTNLAFYTEFKGFDYLSAFKAFIEDELSDLVELLSLIEDDKYKTYFEKKISILFSEIAYATNIEQTLVNKEFWNKFFEVESSLLEFVKSLGSDNSKVKIKIIDRMNIIIDEKEVLTLPKTNANLAFISIFAETHNEKIGLLLKLFKNISEEITYKEIYFLLLLFDALDVIQNTENLLKKHIEKYVSKYSYDAKTIATKKQQLINLTKEMKYIKIFDIDEDADKVTDILKNLQIDFSVEEDGIFVNSFYFNGLENVFSSEPEAMVMTMADTTI